MRSWGSGVARDVISHLSQKRLSGANSPLHEGYEDQLYWQPRLLLANLRPTDAQVEDAYVDGIILALQISLCRTYPRGLSIPSLLVHLSGTVAAFDRRAALQWLPDFVDAIDSHREGNLGAFARLCQSYLNVPVSG